MNSCGNMTVSPKIKKNQENAGYGPFPQIRSQIACKLNIVTEGSMHVQGSKSEQKFYFYIYIRLAISISRYLLSNISYWNIG